MLCLSFKRITLAALRRIERGSGYWAERGERERAERHVRLPGNLNEK